jgi:hypothetical protein
MKAMYRPEEMIFSLTTDSTNVICVKNGKLDNAIMVGNRLEIEKYLQKKLWGLGGYTKEYKRCKFSYVKATKDSRKLGLSIGDIAVRHTEGTPCIFINGMQVSKSIDKNFKSI